MAYQTYITEALVCGSRDQNTSDRSFLLFTREAGMVWASARSVREERSKLRFGLQEFSRIRVTLVRGKGGWRISGVEPIENLYFSTNSRETRSMLRSTTQLLRRVMLGEEPHPALYDDVLASCTAGGETDASARELLLSLRILHSLGYVARAPACERILSLPYAHQGVADASEDELSTCRQLVEQALVESQL